ncbi:MAG: fused response regulator/phosphatase [bacterium]|nr:fused response regulator/phosphatase [bacterium]
MNNDIKLNDPILIVEDSTMNQKLLQSYCDSVDIESVIAGNGQEALELLKTRRFSVFLVDLMMPVMDGREFITHLKEKEPDAVILVQTALDSAETIIGIMKMGVFDYIIKPIQLDPFLKTLFKSLEFKRLKDYKEIQKARFKAEITKIREIEAALLPSFNKLAGFDTAFSILPAEDLSGDFLDAYTIGGDLFQVILCDVSGHGIASSYIGAKIRSMFKSVSREELPPSSLIRDVNNTLVQELSRVSYFGTVAAWQIETGSGKVKYASGGHLPGFLYSAGDKKCSGIKGDGPLIGLIIEKHYSEVNFTMNPGDYFLGYTDGITEALGPDDKTMYGEKRLIEAFIEAIEHPLSEGESSASDIILSILASVYDFTDCTEQQDDVSIICLKKQ